MFIDTHAHIYIDRFKDDINQVIDSALAHRVNQIFMPNIDNETIEDVFNTTLSYPGICRPMVGLHPCSVDKDWEKKLQQLSNYLYHSSIIGIGEIGIDLYWDRTFASAQEEAFRYQIGWAKEMNLPIVIHSRSAIDQTIDIVNELQDGSLSGVFHCFDQSLDHAHKIMDLGFYMGLGGVITYKRNNELRDAIKEIPLASLLLETDAPYLPPVPYRGKRNESAYIPIVAHQLSQIKNVSIEEVADRTTHNALTLFSPLHHDPL